MLQRLREKRPHLVLGYLGCMAQSRGAELLKSSSRSIWLSGLRNFIAWQITSMSFCVADCTDRMDDERLPIVDVEEEEARSRRFAITSSRRHRPPRSFP